MKTEREKLLEIIGIAESLLKESITSSSPEFKSWKMKAERFLIQQFGDKSHEYESFQKIHYGLMIMTNRTPRSEWVDACHTGIQSAIAILGVYLEDFSEGGSGNMSNTQKESYDKVFIVHGHDGELKQSVARVIERQGIEAIILSEQASQGKTIIEKFENNSDVGGAVCLFTADDVGRSSSADSDNPRARQNVVFETGYFIGVLGRDHIVILADHGVEIPSDLSGVVHTNTEKWEVDLLKELKAMGYSISFDKQFG